jgi:hypothetical protein
MLSFMMLHAMLFGVKFIRLCSWMWCSLAPCHVQQRWACSYFIGDLWIISLAYWSWHLNWDNPICFNMWNQVNHIGASLISNSLQTQQRTCDSTIIDIAKYTYLRFVHYKKELVIYLQKRNRWWTSTPRFSQNQFAQNGLKYPMGTNYEDQL